MTAQGIADRRRKVADLYLRGQNQYEIAKKVRVVIGTVSRDLDAIRGEWLRASIQDFNARKSEELARIDQIEREAWAAWERSKKARRKKRKVRTVEVPFAPVDVVSVETEVQVGDPRFLDKVSWCVERRCAIWGFDATKQLQILGMMMHVTPAEEKPELSAEQLGQLADLATLAGVLDKPGAGQLPGGQG